MVGSNRQEHKHSMCLFVASPSLNSICIAGAGHRNLGGQFYSLLMWCDFSRCYFLLVHYWYDQWQSLEENFTSAICLSTTNLQANQWSLSCGNKEAPSGNARAIWLSSCQAGHSNSVYCSKQKVCRVSYMNTRPTMIRMSCFLSTSH
jgi:hypothetical protein